MKSLPRSLDQLPPRHRAEAERQLGTRGSEPHPPCTGGTAASPPRLRQDHGPKMNKLESEWFAVIKGQYPNYPPVRSHAKTYVLANGVRYTPDFSASCWPDVDGEVTLGPARETCWEVKGPHSWDDALVKIKVAAHEWPEVHWIFVWKINGRWCQQHVLP